MPRRTRVNVSHKARRLVERALRLHAEKAIAISQPDQYTTLAQSNAARAALEHQTSDAKHALLIYIESLEQQREAQRIAQDPRIRHILP